MKTIRKTAKRGIYFEGNFKLRDANKNWAHPIDFPTVFEAYGQAIKSGNWRSCTSINTPDYVIANYFEGEELGMKYIWELARILENTTWEQVNNDKQAVLKLVNEANYFLHELPVLP